MPKVMVILALSTSKGIFGSKLVINEQYKKSTSNDLKMFIHEEISENKYENDYF